MPVKSVTTAKQYRQRRSLAVGALTVAMALTAQSATADAVNQAADVLQMSTKQTAVATARAFDHIQTHVLPWAVACACAGAAAAARGFAEAHRRPRRSAPRRA